MKRSVAAFMLLATLGGCMSTDRPAAQSPYSRRPAQKAPTYQGPYGEPINAANNPMTGMSPGMPAMGFVAGNNPKAGTDLVQAGYLAKDGDGPGIQQVGHDQHPQAPGYPFYEHGHGITPVPGQGPPGAVAAIGVLPARVPMAPTNLRTSVNFASPDGMRVTWFGPGGWNEQPLITPARYNFLQGGVYRLRLSSVANRLEKVYYPTLEVVPASDKTITYLAHSSVPVTFTDEDFEQVDSGNFLVKVVYLPDLQNQDLAVVGGPNELVSTRLEPGIDPIVEAMKRGTILLVVRMGNIDLNAPNSPAMDAPNPYMMRGMPAPPVGPAAAAAPPVEKKAIPIPLPKQMQEDKKPDEKKPDAPPLMVP